MQLSEREAAIPLGATLMHWGVPFRIAVKRDLNVHEQETVDQAAEKLAAMHAAASQNVDLSVAELALLVEVTASCLAECGTDAVELRLQMKTGEPREVETLIERLKALLKSSHQESLH